MGYVTLTGQAKRDYQRKWLQARRDDWFADKSCVDCGSTENLELDHVDPFLKISHKIWSWSKQRRTKELLKCVPRCSACHKLKTSTHRLRIGKCSMCGRECSVNQFAGHKSFGNCRNSIFVDQAALE